ncbi:MAG: hypothetical protein ACK5TH_20675 [Prosthecobacter sp.]
MSFPHPAHPFSRREVIQAGAVSLLGLGMNHLSALQSMAAPATTPRAKSVDQTVFASVSSTASMSCAVL